MQDEESRALLSSNVSASEWEKFEPEVEKPASDVRQDDHASSTAIGRRRRILIMAVAILTLLSLSLIGLDQVDTSQVKQQAAAHAGQLREDLQAWWGSVVASDNEQVRADKDEDYRQQDAQVEDLEDDEEQDVEDKPSEHSNVFDEFAPNDVIDTFPPFPADILASREDPSARYLAYIPHSGL